MTPATPDTIITDEYIITRRFRTADAFSRYIETEAAHKKLTCLEVLIEYCEVEDIDAESAAVLVNASLKNKLEAEAVSIHLLRRTVSGKLPL